MKTKILLVNPPAVTAAYKDTLVGAETPNSPPVGLAQIAGSLDKSVPARILDLDLYPNHLEKLAQTISSYQPSHVALTGNTPSFFLMLDCAKIIKDIRPETKVILGGVHCTIYPDEAFKYPYVDYVFSGEGDFILRHLIEEKPHDEIEGLGYRVNGHHECNGRAASMMELDNLPFPRYDIAEFEKYRGNKLLELSSPAGYLETSRGCIKACVFCNKNMFTFTQRGKSPERVVSEMKQLIDMGFKELHIVDDAFAYDIDRVIKICDLIIENKLNIRWSGFSGITVDKADYTMLKKMKKAGVWQISFGIESGSQLIHDKLGKKINLEQIRAAVDAAKECGIETLGFFILGHHQETVETALETINFAIDIDIDLAKFSIIMPYPGTALFKLWEREGRILTYDWSKYACHNNKTPVYKHPNLTFKQLTQLYKKAYRDFYLRPSYIKRRLSRSIRRGQFLSDINIAMKTKWLG